METIAPYTEADPVAVLAHLLVGVGNLIGPGPHALVGHARHPLRLYAALVGQSAKGRKGTAWTTPRHLLAHVDEAWRLSRVKTGLSSGEGIIYHVRDARDEQQPIREKGRVVGYEQVTVDAGEPDKRLLVIEPELTVVLKRMGREGNSLSGVIRDAWDTGDLSTLTKSSPLRATGAHLASSRMSRSRSPSGTSERPSAPRASPTASSGSWSGGPSSSPTGRACPNRSLRRSWWRSQR